MIDNDNGRRSVQGAARCAVTIIVLKFGRIRGCVWIRGGLDARIVGVGGMMRRRMDDELSAVRARVGAER
ncbi:hypothetical protein [Methylobacterium brachiatum]